LPTISIVMPEEIAMLLSRRALLGAGALVLVAPRVARAAWPADRPIDVIVPFPPGGGMDTMARVFLPFVQAHLPGANFVIANRPGAGGQIGWEALRAAAPNGFTLGAIAVPALVTLPIERRTRFKATEFSFIANVVEDPGGLFVGAGSPLRTLADLVAAARERPGDISYGTDGVGSDDHLMMLSFEEVAGIAKPMNHIPYPGTAPMVVQLMGGHLDVGVFNMSESLSFLRDGKIRALGQAAATRGAATPDLPTFREQGFDLVSSSSRGFVAPPGLPAEVQGRLETAFAAALADPGFRREAERLGLPLVPLIGADYRAMVERAEASYRALWQRRPWREG
jgi:tripartite-type tricarboxylate transporter receptor subunit TctC